MTRGQNAPSAFASPSKNAIASVPAQIDSVAVVKAGRRRSHQQRFCRPPLRLLGRTSWRPPGGQGYLGLPTAGHPCLVRLLSADALSAAAVPRAGSSNAWSQEARGSVNRPTGAGAAETDRTSRRGEATSAGAKAYRNGCAPSEVGGHRRQKLVD